MTLGETPSNESREGAKIPECFDSQEQVDKFLSAEGKRWQQVRASIDEARPVFEEGVRANAKREEMKPAEVELLVEEQGQEYADQLWKKSNEEQKQAVEDMIVEKKRTPEEAGIIRKRFEWVKNNPSKVSAFMEMQGIDRDSIPKPPPPHEAPKKKKGTDYGPGYKVPPPPKHKPSQTAI